LGSIKRVRPWLVVIARDLCLPFFWKCPVHVSLAGPSKWSFPTSLAKAFFRFFLARVIRKARKALLF
jgi:hypothetical protein